MTQALPPTVHCRKCGRNATMWLTNNTASDYLHSFALLPMPHLTASLVRYRHRPSLMNIFKKIGQEVYYYESDLDIYALRLQMGKKFAATSSAHQGLGLLQGKFTKQLEFEIWPVGEIAYIRRPGGPLPTTYIKGELVPNNRKTAVIIQIVPFTAWIPLFCSMVLGVVGLSQFVENTNAVVLIVSLVLLFGMPVIFTRIIVKQKQRLRENFNRLFGFTLVKAFSDEPLPQRL